MRQTPTSVYDILPIKLYTFVLQLSAHQIVYGCTTTLVR